MLLVLIALVARVDAAPDEQALAMARRYADLLTGVERADTAASGDVEDADDDDDDDDDGDAGDDDDARDEDLRAALPVTDSEAAAAGTGLVEEDGRRDVTGIAGSVPATPRGDPVEQAVRELLALAGKDGRGEDDELAEPASSDSAGGDPGPDAMLDAERAPEGGTTGDDAGFAAAAAGAVETYEAWMRRHRPALWGRLDLGIDWRRGYHAPRHTPAYRSDEIWLFATWRR
ncbi:MAG TPA: hypothetical protein VFT22_38785 [Kofleriaceae bacterium]|nr:hypothetical protein [Kofleriaceae bacterium]